MNDARKRELIARAAEWRSGPDSCNSLYMGSMATCGLFADLGGIWGTDSLPDVLTRASSQQLDAGMARCANIVKHMLADKKPTPTQQTARLQRAIDRFARAVEEHAFLGTIPLYSDDPEEQRAIDRERSRRVGERKRAETALKKLFEGRESCDTK